MLTAAWTIVAGRNAIAQAVVFAAGSTQSTLHISTAVAVGAGTGTQMGAICATGRSQGHAKTDHELGGVIAIHILSARGADARSAPVESVVVT
ncbi:hypothetical protein D3C78_1224380 [compost metagenome]